MADAGVDPQTVHRVRRNRAEARNVLRVLVGLVRQAQFAGGVTERRGGRMPQVRAPDPYRSPVSVHGVGAVVQVGLQAAKQRQHAVVRPVRPARGRPAGEVLAPGPYEVASVHGGGTAEYAPPRYRVGPVRGEADRVVRDRGALRLRTGDEPGVQQLRWEVRQLTRHRSGLQQQYQAAGVLAQPRRQRGTAGAGPHHDDIGAPTRAVPRHGARPFRFDTGCH